MADLLTFPNPGDELAIEPDELLLEIEPEIEPEPDSNACDCIASGNALKPKQHGADPHAKDCNVYAATPAPVIDQAIVPAALMEILPADFQLPLLTKFIPNPALRGEADKAATYALSMKVEGAEGLQRADLALSALRTSLKAIDDHFEEPTAIANLLHKRLTSVRGEWQAAGKTAVQTVGNRIYIEKKRLDDLAAEQRRKDQAEADRKAREDAQREADAAEQAQAPAPVVEELKRQAQTVTAPPVAAPAAAPVLKGSTTVTAWKTRIAGTNGSEEANPKMAELTPAQRLEVMKAFKAVLAGSAPMTLFDINWSLLNGRAKAEKSTFSIPGFEAYEEGSVRAKGSRAK